MRAGVRLGPWCAAALLASGCDRDPEPDLAEVSEQVQYESVARLGPHRMSATTRRQELRDGSPVTSVQEALEIAWQGWDDFEMRRLVDGEQVSLVRVVGGSAWSQRGDGSWVRRGDPEPWRQELRIAWSAWDQALDPFDDRVALSPTGDDIVEGRRVRRYTVSLAPDPTPTPQRKGRKGKRRRGPRGDASGDRLLSLEGDVVLDEATATRLLARVAGRWEQDGRVRTVALDLARSGIGQPITLASPTPPTRRSARRADPTPDPGSP